jgi:hypothetical protein
MYPIQFNPVDSVVRAYHYFRPELTFTGTPVENAVGLGPFEEIGRRCLLNYRPNSTEVTDDSGDVHIFTTLMNSQNKADYLIIIPNSLWEHGDYDSLAYWRAEHNHYDVGAVKLGKIYNEFCSSPEDSCIKEFLKYAYQHYRAPQMPDSHPAYVLLIGDVWNYDAWTSSNDSLYIMPTHFFLSHHYPTHSDVWYGCLDGDDDRLPELSIGRFPVQNSADLEVEAMKTYKYESSPDTGDWRRDYLLAISDSCPGGVTPIFAESGYDTIVLGSDLTKEEWEDSLKLCLNCGELIFHHYGHEDRTLWIGPNGAEFRTRDAASRNNDPKLQFVLGQGCNGGKFDRFEDGIAQAFMKNDSGGSVTLIANAGSPVGRGSSGDNFFKKIFSSILDDQEWIVGNAIQQARVGQEKCITYNLLGDPMLDLGDYTAYPGYPDLVVRAKHLSIGPDYPSFGDSLTIQVQIFNIGSGDVDSFVVMTRHYYQQQCDTVMTDTIPSFGAREDTLLEFKWSTAPDTAYDIGTHEIEVWVDPDDSIDESWEGNNKTSITKHIFFYPNEPGWPHKTSGAIRSSPALADLFGDSRLEIVVGSDNDTLYAFHASGDPDSGWAASTGAPVEASPVTGDLDNDGALEVVVGAGNKLFAWDTSGTLLANWPIALCGTTGLVYTPAIADIDGDDTLDAIVPADSSVHIIRYDTTSVSGWPVIVASNVGSMSSPAVADVNADEGLEIFVSAYRKCTGAIPCDSCFVYAWDDTGAVLSGWPPDIVTRASYLSPALANLDDSGDWEIMAGLGDSMYVWDDSGNRVSPWPVAAPPTRVSSSPAVGDLDYASTGYEIIAGCLQDNDGDGQIYAWESDGDVAQGEWPVDTKGSVRSSPALANIDSSGSSPDTLLEVIAGSDGGYVYAFDNEGFPLSNFPFPTGAAVTSSPAIADVDRDGNLELVVGCQDHYVLLWSIEGAECDIGAAPWPMFKHDRKRTAWFEYTP